MRRIITLLIFTLCFTNESYADLNINLDFEDGELHYASGWVEDALAAGSAHPPSYTITSGGVGGNFMLQAAGDNHFGIVKDLSGLLAPTDSWIFSADLQRITGDSPGTTDIAISILFNGFQSIQTVFFHDNSFHNLKIDFDALSGTIRRYIDGNLAGTDVPEPPSPGGSSVFPAGAIAGLFVGFGNDTYSVAMNIDNVRFVSISAVPEPSSILLATVAAVGSIGKLRKHSRSI